MRSFSFKLVPQISPPPPNPLLTILLPFYITTDPAKERGVGKRGGGGVGGMLPLFLYLFYINRADIQYLYILLKEYQSCFPHCFRSVIGILYRASSGVTSRSFELGPAEIRTRANRDSNSG